MYAIFLLCATVQAIRLETCSQASAVPLVLGTESVKCVFDIESRDGKRVNVTIGADGALLPLYISSLENQVIQYTGEATEHDLPQSSPHHSLVVVFPYTECTVRSALLGVSVNIDGQKRMSVHFEQAAECRLDRLAFAAVSPRSSGTLAFAIIFVLAALCAVMIMCMYITPDGHAIRD
jgi:hypothetical protein